VRGSDSALDSKTTALFPPGTLRATQFYIGEGRPCLKTGAGSISKTCVG
jgi:hypothetical protein